MQVISHRTLYIMGQVNNIKSKDVELVCHCLPCPVAVPDTSYTGVFSQNAERIPQQNVLPI